MHTSKYHQWTMTFSCVSQIFCYRHLTIFYDGFFKSIFKAMILLLSSGTLTDVNFEVIRHGGFARFFYLVCTLASTMKTDAP